MSIPVDSVIVIDTIHSFKDEALEGGGEKTTEEDLENRAKEEGDG